MQNSLNWNLYNFKAEMKQLQVATVQIHRTKDETLAAAQIFSYELNISTDTPNDNNNEKLQVQYIVEHAIHITHVNHLHSYPIKLVH